MNIGLISDTHGLLRAEALDALRGCDHIVHGGDIGNAGILDALAATLEPGGMVHVATDHLPYFDVIHHVVTHDPRFALAPAWLPTEEERTDFELEFLAERPIGRMTFQLRPEAVPVGVEAGKGRADEHR